MFLQPSTSVVPTLNQDYPEWHLGRQHYALWYLEILDPALLDYLTALRDQFSDILYTPNTRQFHITLFICGFFNALNTSDSILAAEKSAYNDNFSEQQFKQQRQQLQQLSFNNIQLKTGQINSFQSALFIEIQDDFEQLTQIRQCLNMKNDEIAPIEYCPHITLGLYKHTMNSDEVFARIAKLQQQQFNIDFQQISFGSYQAQLLQGPLTVYEQYPLLAHIHDFDKEQQTA